MNILKLESGNPNFIFWCPGCNCAHGIWVDPKNPLTGAGWSFNGNMEAPTFNPSIRVTGYDRAVGKIDCHSYVRDGVIEFQSDCSHSLRGKKIPMVEFPD